MKKLWCVIFAAALLCCAGGLVMAQTAGSTYYVSAQGSDNNDGLTEATAFKMLEHAVVVASSSDNTIKTVTIIGTLNEASEGRDLSAVFSIMAVIGAAPILITGIPNAPSGRRAVLSASGTQKSCVDVFTMWGSLTVRFEHIEISGSAKTGLEVSLNADVTLGPGAVVRNNSGGGVSVSSPKDESKYRSGRLTLDGGIVENNKKERAGGGIFVNGAFTMKRGSVRNNTAVPDKNGVAAGGGIYIQSKDPVSIEGGDITGNTAGIGGGIFITEGSVTMSGGSVSNNTATGVGGGVLVGEGATFNQRGGTISGNKAPSSTRADSHNLYRMPGSFGTSSSPTPAAPPHQAEGSASGGASSSSGSSSGSSSSNSSDSSSSSVDFGVTFHLNGYAQGWHQNLVSLGIPLQLGVELKLPVVTLDLLGEASGGAGYGNLLEYHLGGMAELYFFRKIGLGAGLGLYGNAMNWGISTDSTAVDPVNYAAPIRTNYYRFALIFRGESKTSLYAELYGDGQWGFGLMFGRVMTD